MARQIIGAWTRTPAVADGLPDDWDEAFKIVSSNCTQAKTRFFDYTPRIVERAWAWLLKEFGQEAEHASLSVRDVVELYLDS